MIVVGIDPDSKAHGFAEYEDGQLCQLYELTLVEIIEWMEYQKAGRIVSDVLFSIEDVSANNFVYMRNNKATKAAQAKVGLCIGRCQQAQQELMRILDHYKAPYVLHKPQKGNWAKNKKQFQQVTGWTGRSNEDTRAAAFFGWLALK